MATVISIERLKELQETIKQLEVRTKRYIYFPDYPTFLEELQQMKENYEEVRDEYFNDATINDLEYECIVWESTLNMEIVTPQRISVAIREIEPTEDMEMV